MQRKFLKLIGISCIATLFCFSGCSNDYDLDNNVDLTMGLGSKGLTLKVGTTEPIYLRDLLKVADSDILDTLKTGDGRCLYYVSKGGTVNTSIDVEQPDPVTIDEIKFNFDATTPVTTTIPTGTELPLSYGSDQDLKFDVSNIDECIKEIVSVIPQKTTLTCDISTTLDGAKIVSDGAKIKFPPFVKSAQLDAENCLAIATGASQFSITIDSLYFTPSKKPVDNKLAIAEAVKILGSLKLKAETDIPVTPGMKIAANLKLNFNKINVESISGKIEKSINAKSEEMDIKADIPDFLKENDVKIYVDNPTVKLTATPENDGWPLPIDFSANIKTKRDNVFKKDIALPAAGYVVIPANQKYTCYFYDGDKPFDITGPVAGELYKIPELSTLFETIPDVIVADVESNHVKINQSSIHRLAVGKKYTYTINYDVNIPLAFKENSMIVYNDSVDDMNKDIKKYSADSVKISATVENTIPLSLTAEAFAYGVDGRKINEVTITKDVVKPAKADGTASVTDITLNISCTNPAAFKKIDKVLFKASCVANSTGQLKSSQYLKIKDCRFVLLGPITGDFN